MLLYVTDVMTERLLRTQYVQDSSSVTDALECLKLRKVLKNIIGEKNEESN